MSNYLESKIPSLRDLAIREFKPEALLTVALWDLKRQPELAQCTPESILYCIKFAVQHGLELGGTVGHLHMVPFGKVATPIVGYKGVVAVLTDPKRGNLRSVSARPIYEKDGFKCNYTTDGIDFEHKPLYSEARGEMIGVWAAFRDQDDKLLHVEVMTRAEVDKIRKSSKAANATPWVTWYEEKAKVCAVKRGAKYIPIGHNAAQMIAEADEIEFGKGAVDVTSDAEVETVPTKTEGIKEKLKAKGTSKPVVTPPPAPEPDPFEEAIAEDEDEAEVPPEAKYRLDLAERVEEQLAIMDNGEYEIAEWAKGNGKPKNWNWKLHSNKGDLEKILALLQEVTLTQ